MDVATRTMVGRTGDEMTSDESGGSESEAPGGRRRRPPSTIELEATEVAGEPGAGDSAQLTPEPDPAAEPRAAEREPTHQEFGRRRRGVWGLIGAGLSGAAITVVILGALWIFDILPGSNEEFDDEGSELSDKIAVLEEQVRELAARTQAPDQSRTEAIDARLKKLEAAAAAPGAPGSDAALAEKLADLDRRTERALAAANEAKARADAAASQAQKADAQTAAKPAERSDLEVLAARVANLEQQVTADAQRLGKVAAGADRTVRLALVAMELRIAVERGAPFAAELAAAKQLAADPAMLAALEPASASVRSRRHPGTIRRPLWPARSSRRPGATSPARLPTSSGCRSRSARRPPAGSRPPRPAWRRSMPPESSRRTRSKRSPDRPNEAS